MSGVKSGVLCCKISLLLRTRGAIESKSRQQLDITVIQFFGRCGFAKTESEKIFGFPYTPSLNCGNKSRVVTSCSARTFTNSFHS